MTDKVLTLQQVAKIRPPKSQWFVRVGECIDYWNLLWVLSDSILFSDRRQYPRSLLRDLGIILLVITGGLNYQVAGGPVPVIFATDVICSDHANSDKLHPGLKRLKIIKLQEQTD
jgi:hypothetical protein